MFDTRFRICFKGLLRCPSARQRDNLSPLSSQLQHRLAIVQMAVQQRWPGGGGDAPRGSSLSHGLPDPDSDVDMAESMNAAPFSNSSQAVEKDRLKPHEAFHDPLLETLLERSV
jgi:hypothetical protein